MGLCSSYRYCPANSNQGRYYAQIIRAGKLEARPFFFLNFKGTPSQEKHKTIFSSLMICKMALSDQSDFPAIFRLLKMTYRISSIPEYDNPLSPFAP
jgi:hypothetical protein